MAEWVKTSRFAGVLRYHYKNIGRLVAWALIIVLAAQMLALLAPMVFRGFYSFDGIRGSFEIVFFAAFIVGIITAGRGSRFLIRFGTPRTSVWLGSVLGQLLGMVALLIATFLINMLIAGLLFPLSSVSPVHYGMSASLFSAALTHGLNDLPGLLLYTLEWTSIFYLYGCMLRRFKVLTISVSIGVPLMFVILMLIPAVREALSVVQGDNQGQMVLLGLQWLQWLQDVIRFVEEHWETLQLATAIACLPLSYIVMRGTKQP
ncbi:MAG TPA: hypothetical protein PKU80_11335 [Candidatus Limiplasma sp.]|nr:hypothetical protein [Candidatus Limiplasma sp.]